MRLVCVNCAEKFNAPKDRFGRLIANINGSPMIGMPMALLVDREGTLGPHTDVEVHAYRQYGMDAKLIEPWCNPCTRATVRRAMDLWESWDADKAKI